MRRQTIKRLTVVLTALAAGWASAGLIAVEQFNYSGSNVFGENGGSGWSDAWYKADMVGNPTSSGDAGSAGGVGSGSLINSAFTGVSSASGNHIALDIDGPRSARLLSSSLSMDVDADYYFSFTMATGHNVTGNEIQFLGVSDLLVVGMREGNATQANARVVGGGGTQAKFGLWNVDTVYYFVGKISASAAGNDVIYANIYAEGDTVASTEGSWSLQSGGAALTGNITGILLGHNGNNTDNVTADGNPTVYDEFRLGTDYASVIPEPSTLGLFGFAVLVLRMLRRRSS